MKKKLIGILSALCLLAGCGRLTSITTDFFSMDTFMSLTVWAGSEAKAQAAAAQIEQRINALNNVLSRQVAASTLAQLNAANGQPVTLDADAYAVLSKAVQYAELTGGAFDPTTAPLSDLWGIGTEQAAVPTEEALQQALRHVGYQNIELLGENQARLKNGAQVDLGGIGKGYATDIASSFDTTLLVSLGGNIGAYGQNPDREDGSWKIGLADPDNSAAYIATVSVQNESVVTSGDYERYFEQDGVRYHHIFDPATGYPAQTGLRAVTVVAEESTFADAMTTALFVMGLEKGKDFCAQQGIDAAFITADHKIYITEGMQGRLTLADGADYEIIT